MKAILKTLLLITAIYLIYTTAFLVKEYAPALDRYQVSYILSSVGHLILFSPVYKYFKDKEKVK